MVLSNEWSASVPTLVVDGVAINHQWSKGDEFEQAFRRLVAGCSGTGAVGVLYLRPRTELWVAEQFARLARVPPRLPELQPRLPPGPGPPARPLVRDVRQVLLHRPDPVAVHGAGRPRGDLRRGPSRWRTRPTRTRFARCSGSATTPGPSSASATSTSAGPPCSWPPSATDRAEHVRCSGWRDRGRRVRRRRHSPMRRSAPRAAGAAPHSGALCASRSPGPRSLTRRSASGAWASRDRPASAAWPHGRRADPGRRRAGGAAEVDGRAVLATEPDGLRALLGMRRRRQEPGHQPLPARGGAARGRPGSPVCGGLGLFMAEADPARVACITGTKGKSTTTAIAVHLLAGLGYDARAGGNIGRPPWDPSEDGRPRLLDRRDLELPGARPRGRSPRGRRDVAVARPPRLARHGRALLRRQALAVHQARRDAGRWPTAPTNASRAQAGAAGPARALGGRRARWRGTTAWSSALGLAGPAQRAQRVDRPRRARRALGIPEAADEPSAGAGRRRLRRRCPADSARSAASARSSSSTTASRPTCCRRRPPSPPSPTGRSRCSWAGTTAASTTRRWPGPLAGADGPDARGDHARQRPAHRRAPSGRSATGASKWWTRDGPGRRRGQPRSRWAAAGGVVLLSPAAPSFGRFGDYRERSAAFAAAAARYGPLS